MADEPITLYSYALSPYAAKVHLFLVFKGLDFETFYVDPRRVTEQLPVGRKVPVLAIGEQARADSTPIGLWIEERFPGPPALLPKDPASREALLAIDAWVSERLIPGAFRVMLAARAPWPARIRNRRRGARALHATVEGGLPAPLRLLYPFVIGRVGFLRRILAETDASLSEPELLRELFGELRERLAGGPFLGGRPESSLADLSAFAQLALPYMAGYDHAELFLEDAELLGWMERVAGRLDPAKPLLPPSLCERPLPGLERPSPRNAAAARA